MSPLVAWSRADIISALALFVSCLAFIASAVSSLVAWRIYLATKRARKPIFRVYFEPFVDSDEWWVARFYLRNRSENVLRFESIQIVRPFRAVISNWLGGYTSGGTGSGPWHNDLPKEVLSVGTTKKIDRLDEGEAASFEFQPSTEVKRVGELIVKLPKWHLSRHAVFCTEMMELGEFPKIVLLRAAAPFPTKQNTKPRY